MTAVSTVAGPSPDDAARAGRAQAHFLALACEILTREQAAAPNGSPSAAERVERLLERAADATIRSLTAAGAPPAVVSAFRDGASDIRAEVAARAARLEVSRRPFHALEAFAGSVESLKQAVRRDPEALGIALRQLGAAGLALDGAVSKETKGDALEEGRQDLVLAALRGAIEHDPEAVLNRLRAGAFRGAGLKERDLALLEEEASRRAREIQRGRELEAAALDAARILELETRVERGEAGEGHIRAAGLAAATREALLARARDVAARQEREAEAVRRIADVAAGMAPPGEPADPDYRRAVERYYGRVFAPALAPRLARDGEAAAAEVALFVARTGVAPGRLRLRLASALMTPDDGAVPSDGGTVERMLQAAMVVGAIDRAAPGLLDREAAGGAAAKADVLSLFTPEVLRRARDVNAAAAAGLPPAEAARAADRSARMRRSPSPARAPALSERPGDPDSAKPPGGRKGKRRAAEKSTR